ncbi:MAG: alpha/beta hydrolase [Chlorobi bacterium]|nr:alpha/beta hydrolase [Chlorobiota bacterium]
MKRKSFILIFLVLLIFNSCAQNAGQTDRPPKMPRGYLNETHLKVAYALGFLDLIDTKPTVPEDIDVFKDIVYKQVDTTSLKLDIYKLKNIKTPAPVLIFIHGGGWSKGQRSDYLPYLIDFANKGYITVTVSYRLSGTAHFPAAVEDVKCAVRWIKAHAACYDINPDKVALIGGSAGGHLAMMVGYSGENAFSRDCADTVSAKVQVVVDLYGPVDLTTEYAQNRHECLSFLGKTYREDPDLYAAASPRFHITPGDPPTLIFHGTIDNLVPVSQADSLHKWLDMAGVPNRFYKLKGWPHTMDAAVKVNAFCRYYMDRFFNQYLQPVK